MTTEKNRLYIIRDSDAKPVALIRAQNISGAGRMFLERSFTVAYAEQDDILAAAKAGIEPQAAEA